MICRPVLNKIYDTVVPISENIEKFLGQPLYKDFKDNFFINYEKLRKEAKGSLFGNAADTHLLDRHKVSALVAIAILSTSTYVQNIDTSLPQTGPVSDDLDYIRYNRYPNEIFAWQGAITILLNYIIKDASKDDESASTTLAKHIFSSTNPYYQMNPYCLGCFSVQQVGDSTTQYIDTILMLLNYYNYYNQFNVITLLSLAQLLYFFELKITPKSLQ